MQTLAKAVLKFLTYKYLAIVTLAASVFFSVVNPSKASTLMIFVGSVLLALLLYVWAAFLIGLVALFRTSPPISRRLLAVLISASCIFLLLLQSIGELSWRDTFVIVLLAFGIYVYLTYLARSRSHT